MNKLSRQLKAGGSTIAFVAASSMLTGMAHGQTTPPQAAAAATEEVVVTGTSIRGAAPVGANLITVGPQDIEKQGGQTLDEVLKSVPALSDMGQVGQSQHNSTYFSPNIHQLGASASSSTLVIMDGMRFPLGGTSHSQPDPSIVPVVAIQRVEVLADGSSSIYGSDAVAGVINFITRTSYDGLQITGEAGEADNYNKINGSLLWGTNWKDGGVMFAFQHSYLSDLALNTRVTDYNFIPLGGTNQNNFNCSPATIQVAGNTTSYYKVDGTAISNAQTAAPCNQIASNYLLPKETRDNAMARFTQDYGDLTISGTLLLANRKDVSFSPGGTISGATAFGAGAQANPFFVMPPGSPAATKQTIRFDTQGLIPRGISPSGASDMYVNFNARYKFFTDWEAQAWIVAAQDNSYSDNYGGLCGACALLALNGTTNAGGSTTAPSVVGTTLVSTQTLTTANALDVWDPVGTNKTSKATLTAITQGNNSIDQIDTFEQYKIGVNGPLFDLPAGAVKVAFGGEAVDYGLIQKVIKTNNEGPASYGSGFSVFHFPRAVASFYGEVNVPLISPEMNVPLVQKFNVDISGRYDSYSDVGNTANPKFAADWTVIDGLKLRGSYSTSFVAPQLDSVGDPNQNYRAAYGGAGLFSTVTSFPTALYPGTAGVLPGCAVGAVTCSVGTASTQGISLQRGIGPNAKPQKGNGYTVGVDYTPDFLPGFVANVTLFDAHFKGAVTSPNASVLPVVPGLNYLFRIYPNGLPQNDPAVLAALAPYPTLNSAIPTTTYVIDDQSQNNIENLSAQGLDMSFTYDFDTDFGHFRLQENATEFLQYTISFGYPVAGPSYSLLNTDGQTSQFPEIQLQSRGNIGWSLGPYEADLFINYTGSYRNWANPANPITHDANGNPNGGGDPVGSYMTFDIHAAYTMPEGMFEGDQVYVTVINLSDEHPPFYNAAGQAVLTGTDDLVTSLLGRTTTLGFRAKF